MQNPVRKALLERKITIGTWIQIGHPMVGEILGNANFEWIAVDCEHSDIDIKGFTDIARGMHGRGPEPFVRVRENDTLAIRQTLDAGARGIIVPLINNAQEAQKAVASAKYPPMGVRGFCFSRMNEYGKNFDQYVEVANEDIAVVAMIESKEAVKNIDEILAVEGIDGIFIGPYDLSGSYNIPGKTSDPLVRDGCATVLEACKKTGKSAGLHVVIPTTENIKQALDDGFTFLAVGVDMVFLNNAAEQALADIQLALNPTETKNS